MSKRFKIFSVIPIDRPDGLKACWFVDAYGIKRRFDLDTDRNKLEKLIKLRGCERDNSGDLVMTKEELNEIVGILSL